MEPFLKTSLSVSNELKNGMTLIISAKYDDIWRVRYDIGFKILFVALLLAVIFSLFLHFPSVTVFN